MRATVKTEMVNGNIEPFFAFAKGMGTGSWQERKGKTFIKFEIVNDPPKTISANAEG